MTKYLTAKVALVQTKTVWVQVSGDEASATALAKDQAQLTEPGFRASSVELKFVGESELEVGTRVVHRIFGPRGNRSLFSPMATERLFACGSNLIEAIPKTLLESPASCDLNR
jgi:hypothetical protein